MIRYDSTYHVQQRNNNADTDTNTDTDGHGRHEIWSREFITERNATPVGMYFLGWLQTITKNNSNHPFGENET